MTAVRRPHRALVAATYGGLIVMTAVVLYPVLLVVKKAFEPGRQFALSASPVPSQLGTEHVAELFGARAGDGSLLFLRHAANSALVAVITTAVGLILSCTAAYA